MSNIDCNACNTLKNTSPHFVQNGITDTECTSLAADTGLNPSLSPKHTDAEDLHTMNDCLIGRTEGDLEKYDICDWQDFMAMFIGNLYEVLKAIICAIGGIWVYIHNLLSRVASLESRMSALESRVSILESEVAALKTRMTNLEGRVTAAEDAIAGLTTDVNTLKNDVAGLKSEMNSVKARVSTLEGDVANIKGRVTALEGDMSSLKGRVSTLEGAVSNINSEISGIKTDINSVKTRVTNVENTVSSHITQISSLSSTVNSFSSQISNNANNITNLTSRLNSLIEALGGSANVVPVVRRYRVTVPKSAFGQVWRVTGGAQQANNPDSQTNPNYYNVADVTEWFAGSGNNEDVGEFWVKVPVSEMEDITGVWTQTWVVPGGNPYDGKGKGYIQTVNVQQWTRSGDYLDINFDTYELCPAGGGSSSHNGGPYPVTVDFLVVGTKTITPI